MNDTRIKYKKELESEMLKIKELVKPLYHYMLDKTQEVQDGSKRIHAARTSNYTGDLNEEMDQASFNLTCLYIVNQEMDKLEPIAKHLKALVDWAIKNKKEHQEECGETCRYTHN